MRYIQDELKFKKDFKFETWFNLAIYAMLQILLWFLIINITSVMNSLPYKQAGIAGWAQCNLKHTVCIQLSLFTLYMYIMYGFKSNCYL